ncbi:LamG domain-containing protein [Candidatus Poribacteria bacterium]|jgi:hypothetical protein|nr:LamG domain-containing protein [Candidatus Poribacteria bacterium]MBT7809390.1 LamG domain-containing protein [Candidatus Poribacteria bacterium]
MFHLRQAVIVPMLVAATCAYAQLTDGLVGFWTFDEGNGDTTADASGLGNNGTFAGQPAWAPGHTGGAIEFDGGSEVVVEDADSLRLVTGVTIAVWAMPVEGQAAWAKFLIKQKSDEYPYSLQYDDAQGLFGTVHADARFDTSPHLANFPDEWAHLAMTYDGAAVVLYKDGVEVGRNDSATGDLQQNDLPVSIGGRMGSSQDFAGVLDEVYLWNRALGPDDIPKVMEGLALAIDIAGKLTSTWADIKTDAR